MSLPAKEERLPLIQEEAPCTTEESVPLTRLGMPFPPERGEGIDVGALRDACRNGSPDDLSVRLGGEMAGEGSPAAKGKGAGEGQGLRASIGGYQGRLSKDDFIVNLNTTFK